MYLQNTKNRLMLRNSSEDCWGQGRGPSIKSKSTRYATNLLPVLFKPHDNCTWYVSYTHFTDVETRIWRFIHLLSHHCREIEDAIIQLEEMWSPAYDWNGWDRKEGGKGEGRPIYLYGMVSKVFYQTGKHLGCRLEKIIILATLL